MELAWAGIRDSTGQDTGWLRIQVRFFCKDSYDNLRVAQIWGRMWIKLCRNSGLGRAG